jgi:predicted transcriptional regulator
VLSCESILMIDKNSIFNPIKSDMETLKRHISIIQTLLREQPVGIIRIAQVTKLPEHKIRYSLRLLEKQGLIIPSREGAILTPEFVEQRESLAADAKDIASELDSIYQTIKSTLQKR